MTTNSLIASPLAEIAKLMDTITMRQQWTANNIANVHTPNYKPQRASFAELLDHSQNMFETRLAQKMGGSSPMKTISQSENEKVSLQNEMLDLQQNALFYNLVTRRLSSIVTDMRAVAQVGR